jgi:hypothetical protein
VRSSVQIPLACNEFAGRDHRGVADDGDRLASGLDPQNTEAGLSVVKGYPIDQTSQHSVPVLGFGPAVPDRGAKATQSRARFEF